ncbi:MAG: Mov34/MPN/PAD-1 family protein [Anaerolineae bacterium]|nr:Mov34/MPN/PAD-1 family protein [Anaerolineae bacterium]
MQPFIKLPDLVPAQYLQSIIRKSQRMLPNEALFYLSYETAWKAVMPNQRVTQTSVTPSDPFDDFSSRALIELHSHNTMPARFSSIDDGDETGFKLYAVIGNITGSKIELCVRVGIYGHFCEVPAKLVFQSMIEVCDVGRY